MTLFKLPARLALIPALLATAMLLAACGVGGDSAPSGEVTISDAWVALPAPGADRTAGYVTVSNGLDSTIKLVGASTVAFGRTELHTMKNIDGVMKMRPVDGFDIESGASHALEAGGDHLMLLYPRDPVAAGDKLAFSLAMRGPDGGLMSRDVEFEVRAR